MKSSAFGIVHRRRLWQPVPVPRLIPLAFLCLAALTLSVSARDLPELPKLYKATSLEGHIRFAGRKINLPLKPLRSALLKSGHVVVTDNRIPVERVAWAKVLEDLKFKGISGRAVVSGPSDVILEETRTGYRGKTKRPLIVTQRGRYHFIKVTVTMRTNLQTTITDGTLTMQAPVKVQALGLTANGMITMKAEEKPLPPLP